MQGGENSVLGTNVDYASTWLAMAGIAAPRTYDGRSILTQLVPAENERLLPAPTRAQVRADREALAAKPWRTEQFFQYYNQAGLCSLQIKACEIQVEADIWLFI